MAKAQENPVWSARCECGEVTPDIYFRQWARCQKCKAYGKALTFVKQRRSGPRDAPAGPAYDVRTF